jgi:hypothetical protein
MTIQNDDIIELFLGSYGAVPVEGRRPLSVQFTGDPEYDEIVEDETSIYEIVEDESSTAEICELEN